MTAEYVKMLLVGKKAGSEQKSGINSIDVAILIGANSREYLEAMRPSYKNASKPIWEIDSMIPDPGNYSNSIIDACIAFAPHLFEECSELQNVASEIGNSRRIDFTEEEDANKIPKSWSKLREQAKPIFDKISIWEIEGMSSRQLRKKYPKWEGQKPDDKCRCCGQMLNL